MTDEISLDGKQYISSKRASEEVGYSQDYIGQLARGGHIDAKRLGGMWYVSMESLQSYKTDTEAIKPATVKPAPQNSEPESLISFDGKDYISASRASKLTGYNQDYVGQLARAGKILSRQVGNRWYVDRDGILAHKQEKDSLLAAVQAESVGIYSRTEDTIEKNSIPVHPIATNIPSMQYSTDNGDLLPQIQEKDSYQFEIVKSADDFDVSTVADTGQQETQEQPIPIRVVRPIQQHTPPTPAFLKSPIQPKQIQAPRKTIFLGTLAGAALTVVIVLSVGISSFKDNSLYAAAAKSVTPGPVSARTFTAAAVNALNKFGDILEDFVAPTITYVRK